MFGDSELSHKQIRILSFMFVLIALVAGWLSHEKTVMEEVGLLFWKTEVPKTYKIDGFVPSMLSTIIAIIAIAPLYIRKVLVFDKFTVYQILCFILNVSLTATFIQIIIGNSFTILYFITIHNTHLLLLTVLLTWIGMRAVAGFAWIGVIIIAISTIVKANIAMDVSGYIFILAGFLGILLQSGLNPGNLVLSLKEGFFESNIVNLQMKENINASIDATKKISGNVLDLAVNSATGVNLIK